MQHFIKNNKDLILVKDKGSGIEENLESEKDLDTEHTSDERRGRRRNREGSGDKK